MMFYQLFEHFPLLAFKYVINIYHIHNRRIEELLKSTATVSGEDGQEKPVSSGMYSKRTKKRFTIQDKSIGETIIPMYVSISDRKNLYSHVSIHK